MCQASLSLSLSLKRDCRSFTQSSDAAKLGFFHHHHHHQMRDFGRLKGGGHGNSSTPPIKFVPPPPPGLGREEEEETAPGIRLIQVASFRGWKFGKAFLPSSLLSALPLLFSIHLFPNFPPNPGSVKPVPAKTSQPPTSQFFAGRQKKPPSLPSCPACRVQCVLFRLPEKRMGGVKTSGLFLLRRNLCGSFKAF